MSSKTSHVRKRESNKLKPPAQILFKRLILNKYINLSSVASKLINIVLKIFDIDNIKYFLPDPNSVSTLVGYKHNDHSIMLHGNSIMLVPRAIAEDEIALLSCKYCLDVSVTRVDFKMIHLRILCQRLVQNKRSIG